MSDIHQFEHVSPESCGLSSAAVNDFFIRLNDLNGVHSLMLMRHDKIIAEHWWEPFKKEYKHELFSCSKSFVSIAFGIACGEGLISPEDKLISFFPEKISPAVTPAMRKVTMRHLLTMSSGHAACPLAAGDLSRKKDWIKGFLESKLDYEPGTVFVYNSAATYMISATLHRILGKNILDYLNEKMFRHIGIYPEKWDCCYANINIGGWGLWLTTEEMLRFGRLLLHNGSWDGRQLVPEEYFKAATSFQIPTANNSNPDWRLGYGYQFWMSSYNNFRADGACGQFISVMPQKNMVMALTAGISNMQNVLTAFYETIYPVLQNTPLPDNPSDHQILTGTLAQCQYPPLTTKLKKIFTGEYILESNPAGFTGLSVRSDLNGCEIKFIKQNKCESLYGAYNKHSINNIRLNEREERIAAASSAWQGENLLEMLVYSVETPYIDHYILHFCCDSVELERTSNFTFLHDPLPRLKGKKKPVS